MHTKVMDKRVDIHITCRLVMLGVASPRHTVVALELHSTVASLFSQTSRANSSTPAPWATKTTPLQVSASGSPALCGILTCPGGALKLKGVKGGGITKKKKKKSTKKAGSVDAPTNTDVQKQPASSMQPSAEEEEDEDPFAGKTDAERRFEERKREQMEKRLAKEGVKTHKERVEEYNKYLASLSEHHDMYGICGPRWWREMLTFLLQAENRTWLTRLALMF